MYRSGFFSMKVSSLTCWRKEVGVSAMTCSTFIRVCILVTSLRFWDYFEIFDESLQECNKVFGYKVKTDIHRKYLFECFLEQLL